MKIFACFILFSAILAPGLLAQQDDREERPVPAILSVPPEVAAKMLIHRVDPICKPHGMEACVSGTVVLRITISKMGRIENARVISGPAMLQQATLDALRKWEYKPYIVNGKPVEFSTRVSITMSNY
jgi:protein TonB